MLGMVALTGAIVLFTCVIGFAGYMLLAQQKRGQTDTDEIALNMAKLLNDGDRIGQMNNVVERCRELVYISRVNKVTADTLGIEMYQPLAEQLLEESRANSELVEAERKNQIKLAVKNVATFVYQHNMTTKSGSRFRLPWFQTNFPEIAQVNFGSIQGVQCNVENLQVIGDLRENDLGQNYIQAGSNLYMGNIDAKLPAPDNDLVFKLSSLPCDVGGVVAPVRLTNPDVFTSPCQIVDSEKETGLLPDQLPGALQVVETMDVSASDNKGSIRLGSTATADGALPPP